MGCPPSGDQPDIVLLDACVGAQSPNHHATVQSLHLDVPSEQADESEFLVLLHLAIDSEDMCVDVSSVKGALNLLCPFRSLSDKIDKDTSAAGFVLLQEINRIRRTACAHVVDEFEVNGDVPPLEILCTRPKLALRKRPIDVSQIREVGE